MIKKHQLQAAACLAGSVLLYGLLTLGTKPDPVVSADGRIVRDGYGGEDRQLQLYVDGLAEQAVALTVEVGARVYTEAEAKAVFTAAMAEMEDRIRGANPSLMEVRGDLRLPSWLDDSGIRLKWYSSEPELINEKGRLGPAYYELHSDGRFLSLRVRLSAGMISQEFEMPVRVLPPVQGDKMQLIRQLVREIERREEGQRTEEFLSLPLEYEGKILHYRTGEDTGYTVLLVLGVLLAVLCYAKAQADAREQIKKREKELLLDYAEIVSKLMIFTGAGMSIRLVWERIVKDYERSRTAGKQKPRAAYEEMCRSYYQLAGGLSEGEVFREFGRRCRLQPYLKLSSLLEQNRKEGTKHLRAMLQAEMQEAWEMRKNLARKLGEEAGTRLLAPLFLMLGIVMVMVMVPAMMALG